MASQSETDQPQTQTQTSTVIERLITSRNRDLSLFLPFLLGIHGPDSDETTPDPDPSSSNGSDPQNRIILINPYTQAMVVIDGETLASLLRSDPDQTGPPPASKSSIDALPAVEIGEDDPSECAICLEEWKDGDVVVKELPCKHRFHGGCVERWLGIHGSCPVCRFEMMPCCDLDKRGVWVSFSFDGRSNPDRSSSGDGGDTSDVEGNGSGESEISD